MNRVSPNSIWALTLLQGKALSCIGVVIPSVDDGVPNGFLLQCFKQSMLVNHSASPYIENEGVLLHTSQSLGIDQPSGGVC